MIGQHHKGSRPISPLPHPGQRLRQGRQGYHAAEARADHLKVKSRNIYLGLVNTSHKWRKEFVPDLIEPAEEAAGAADEKDRILMVEGSQLIGRGFELLR